MQPIKPAEKVRQKTHKTGKVPGYYIICILFIGHLSALKYWIIYPFIYHVTLQVKESSNVKCMDIREIINHKICN